MITCQKCSNQGNALEEAPFPSELGEKILKNICDRCFQSWVRDSINIVNELQLDLNNPEDEIKYDLFLEEYLFGDANFQKVIEKIK